MVIFTEEEWVYQSIRAQSLDYYKGIGSRTRESRELDTWSQALRTAWQSFILDVTAEQLVFIDESQATNWLEAHGVRSYWTASSIL